MYNLDFKTSLKCKSDSRRTCVDALRASQSIRLDLISDASRRLMGVPVPRGLSSKFFVHYAGME